VARFGVRRAIAALALAFLDLVLGIQNKRKNQSGDASPHSK